MMFIIHPVLKIRLKNDFTKERFHINRYVLSADRFSQVNAASNPLAVLMPP